jgi:ABC-type branched-subunit amino acid transport system substrate-binding protein
MCCRAGLSLAAALLAALLATGAARIVPDDGGFTGTTIRIGVEAAAGSLSLDGENLGFKLAFEEANARGGVHGRRFA